MATKIKWLERRIAHPGPYLTLCINEEQFNKALKDCGVKASIPWIGNDHSDACVHHLNNQSNEAVCIVCIRSKPKATAIEVAGLIVHESVHVWQSYCESIGESDPGCEQEAYGIQGISQTLLQAYSDHLEGL
jgi:hypothetical protein